MELQSSLCLGGRIIAALRTSSAYGLRSFGDLHTAGVEWVRKATACWKWSEPGQSTLRKPCSGGGLVKVTSKTRSKCQYNTSSLGFCNGNYRHRLAQVLIICVRTPSGQSSTGSHLLMEAKTEKERVLIRLAEERGARLRRLHLVNLLGTGDIAILYYS